MSARRRVGRAALAERLRRGCPRMSARGTRGVRGLTREPGRRCGRISTRTLAGWTALAASCLAVSGCATTQQESARLAKQGQVAFKQTGLQVTQVNTEVKVLSTTVLSDQNGSAAVVEVRNTTDKTLVQVPIAINVLGANGKTVYKNDDPQLAPPQTHIPLLMPHQDFTWVNDNLLTTDTPKSVKATLGAEQGDNPGKLPPVYVTRPQLQNDPTSGLNAAGTMHNNGSFWQVKWVVFCVARKDGRVVAAGNAEAQRLKPGGSFPYHAYFIGNPTGAQLSIEAPPASLK